MKRIVCNLFSFLILSLLIYSCGSCPPSENIGEVKLSNSTTGFIPYFSGETVLDFKNADGQLLFLISEKGKESEKYNRVVDSPCSIELIDATYISMTLEKQEIYFKNDSIKIRLVANFSYLKGELNNQIDTNWVESVYCIIGNSYDNLNNKSFTIITDNRGKDISQNDIESYLFIDTLTLLNKTFYNVYSDKLGQDIFFNKSVGILGFKYNSELYLLERAK